MTIDEMNKLATQCEEMGLPVCLAGDAYAVQNGLIAPPVPSIPFEERSLWSLIRDFVAYVIKG